MGFTNQFKPAQLYIQIQDEYIQYSSPIDKDFIKSKYYMLQGNLTSWKIPKITHNGISEALNLKYREKLQIETNPNQEPNTFELSFYNKTQAFKLTSNTDFETNVQRFFTQTLFISPFNKRFRVQLITQPHELIHINSQKGKIPATQIILLFDSRHKTLNYDFLGEFSNFTDFYSTKSQNEINFLLIDMSIKPMFEYVADKYRIGNFDTPGIFATSGESYYYKNYQRYSGPSSFQQICPEFVESILNGTKQKLSTNTVTEFFTVNLLNTEYYKHNYLQAFITFNGFLASLLLVLLAFDTFVKPIMGKGPTFEMAKNKREVNADKHFKNE